ncbi:MAG: metallophosphoesterase family protein, partial [Chloroflexi bacterium]|nr:metallophosphoesterase family protein [Chloroflexota bacterium]
MRVAIISDIHANFTAFERVLQAIGSVDEVWCLGDVVSYGPDPNECIAVLQSLPNLRICLTGNHDAAVIGEAALGDFNPDAQQALLWTREQLTPQSDAFLRACPPMLTLDEQFTVAHASPRQPIWEYITSTALASENFPYFDTPVCLVGHTHVPLVFSLGASGHVRMARPHAGAVLELDSGARYI